MLVAVDLDGTIDAFPREFQSLMQSLRAAGHRVVVLTGTADVAATQQVWDEKAAYLLKLGCGQCYDQLVVIAHPDKEIADMKSDWLEENGADILIDNKKANGRKAPCLTLIPWQSRKK